MISVENHQNQPISKTNGVLKFMVKKLLSTVILLTLFGFSASASPLDPFKGMKGSLDIAGGTAHIPVMKQAAQNIMTFNPDIRITVAGGGSGVGVQQVGEGIAHIGNTGRPLKPEEMEKYGLVTHPFAIDGVAVAVHPSNPVKALTSAQVADIYSGKITDWTEVGGTPGAINVFGREDGSGTRDNFTEKVLGKQTIASSVNVVSSNGAMKTALSRDVRGIGYVGIGYLDDSVAGVTLDGVEPTQENAAKGTYSVVRYLYMNTKGQPEGLTAAFIDYIYSPEGQKIIEEDGYIPLPRK